METEVFRALSFRRVGCEEDVAKRIDDNPMRSVRADRVGSRWGCQARGFDLRVIEGDRGAIRGKKCRIRGDEIVILRA